MRGGMSREGRGELEDYIICWKSRLTEKDGRGTARLPKEEAQSLVEWLNKKYPNIYHWAESDSSEQEEE